MRVKVDYRTASRTAYNRFCSIHSNIRISFEDWEKVIYSFNQLLRDYILESGDKVKLFWGFGSLAISKKKPKKTKEYQGKTYINLPPDWKKTKENDGKMTYHLNAHTDGYKFKWYWFNRDARFYMSEIWVFKPSRLSSRKITEYVNKTSPNYVEIYKKWDNR